MGPFQNRRRKEPPSSFYYHLLLVGQAYAGSAVGCPSSAVRQTAIREIVTDTGVGIYVVNRNTIYTQQAHIVAGIVQVVCHFHEIVTIGFENGICRNLLRRAAGIQQVIDPHTADVQSVTGRIVKLDPFRSEEGLWRRKELVQQNLTHYRRARINRPYSGVGRHKQVSVHSVVDAIGDLNHHISVNDDRIIVITGWISDLGQITHGAVVVQTVKHDLIWMAVSVGAACTYDGHIRVEGTDISRIG